MNHRCRPAFPARSPGPPRPFKDLFWPCVSAGGAGVHVSHLAEVTMNTTAGSNLLWPTAAILLLFAGIWAWSAGLSGPYHFDDYVTPLNDPASQSLKAFGEYLPITLRPVTKFSYALEAEAGWTAEPAPRRVASI